ncbi:MAG: cytochrome b N-terminal domain-containing protein, partial [Vicinamibacterales bacterium]
MAWLPRIADWLHERTGYRTILALARDPSPHRVHWAYTLGMALLALLIVQAASGVTLMLYYVPSPTHAYDSVRYIEREIPLGWLVRGIHYYGASFLVAIAAVHLLRALWFGAYKAPREFTWLSGFVLFVLIVAFGLTGYLLPWDQLGYWSTVVRANIAGTTPLVGAQVAALMRGGPNVGALTLSRWYALHVAVLPAALTLFTVTHLYLVRRHGRAGHYVKPDATPRWMPTQMVRSNIVAGAMLGVLMWVALRIKAPLESMADTGDFSFIPHPEWYFLWLFQLMKLTQGPLEAVGAPVVLMVVIGFLVMLPFLDRSEDRHPRRRRSVMAATTIGLAGISFLTWMAARELAPPRDPSAWSPVAIAGHGIVSRKACLKCHGADSVGPSLTRGHIAHDTAWIKNHLSDPDVMAPGIRPIPFDAPTRSEAGAVLAFARMVRAGAPLPVASDADRAVATQYAMACASCHTMDGDGVNDGPDLSHAGRHRDAAWIAKKIVDPTADDPKARMPSLKDKMSLE